ncbi:hypothetical protein Taro_001284 [Colocasia esculenta]|uniref:Uncharacterized protein n=1 Tax=Colocasia esculenta TaxID=4460 RepID=A0A843TKB0_COLES|nr:hypothetical protein [Colocasia esculenta]
MENVQGTENMEELKDDRDLDDDCFLEEYSVATTREKRRKGVVRSEAQKVVGVIVPEGRLEGVRDRDKEEDRAT